MASKKPFERLPQTVVPRHYDVKLTPDIPKFTFAGEEIVDVEVKESTETVVLNSAELTISAVEFRAANGGDAIVGDAKFDADAETVSLQFPQKLPTGNGRLSIVFAGELNDKMRGFYRTKYTTSDGEERYAAVTQFEATDARRALPCWDEPALKATFDVTLVVPKDRVALSNMPVKTDEPTSDGLKRIVRYERTPIMSTYLLAFIVGEYDYVEGRDADGVLVRVYTPVGKAEQGRFALDVAIKTLPFYKEYFNIPYPLPKMDLIALADFAAGAMENWGLVTYRETALLVDPESSSAASKQWVALVVGHELAHQWFGNLVTMEWWTHLWLNEGFASWIEYLCVDRCFPEYDIWTQFVTNDLIRALELDAMANSHPIEVPVGHPSEVDEIFDAISYSKGSSVIRMLHSYIGDDAFRRGMHNYLTRHSYSNTFTEDLWEALGEASGKPVAKVMQTWTKQMGFPVLEVSSEQHGNDRVLHITQQKFGAGASDQEWIVPVDASTSASPNAVAASTVLESREGELVVKNTPSNQWVKLNPGAVGFYRVKYSEAMLSELMPGIRGLSMSARDRLNLQDDLFALAQAGQASTVDALRLIGSYGDEPDYTVWSSLASNIETLGTLLAYSGVDAEFSAFSQRLFSPVLSRLGWDPAADEGHLPALLRSLVIGQLGRHGHAETVQEAQKRFAAHCDGSSVLPANLRAAVYNTVLSSGDEAVYQSMLKLFDAADIHEERVRIMRSLGSIRDKTLLEKTLAFAVSEKVRSQDTAFVIGSVAGRSRLGRELAWTYLQENWSMLLERFQGLFLLARLIKSCSSDFVTEERAAEVEKFFASRPCPGAERTVQQAIENIRRNAKWLARDGDAIKAYLRQYSA